MRRPILAEKYKREKGEKMKIIGIDPGPVESAYVLIEKDNNQIKIKDKGKIKNHDLLLECRDQWNYLGDRVQVAVEMVASYGMPVGAEVFETCVFIGRIIEALVSVKTTKVYRKDVKMHLCHSMRAKDGNIRQALIDKYGEPGTKKNPGILYGVSGDVWAALAVAVTYMESGGLSC